MTRGTLHIKHELSRNILRAFLCVLLWITAQNVSAQVRSSVDSTSIKIGEEIQYTIEVVADTTDLVVFPEGQTFLPLEVIESYKIDTTYEQAKYRLIKKYGLTQFDSGSYTIPPQRVVINERTAATDSLRIEVRDVAVDTTQQKMFDIKPAMDVADAPYDFLKVLYWLLPFLLLLAVLGYVFFRRKKRKEAEVKQLPPYEEAIVALKALDHSDLLKQNRSKEYYSQLTEIVKRYLDREVDDAALESTSDELIARLQLHKDAGHFDFDTETIKHLDDVLKRADLVKFAKMQQATGQAEADRKTIESIITETHEVIPEPSEEELLRNEAYAEAARKEARSRKRKRLIGIAVMVVLVTITVSGVTQGWGTMWENLFGTEMSELAKGRWIKSEYGNPAVIIETPEVLVRKELSVPDEVKDVVSASQYFEFGNKDVFYISVNTTTYNSKMMEDEDMDLDVALEGGLKGIEALGGINIVTKTEEFSTDKGITGLKAYGEFELSDKKDKKIEYEMLLFKQNKGLQIITIIYEKDLKHAEKMKERIVRSVELEIMEGAS
ncbi:MAG: BatD family protein [Altibacter sp.]|nr:BatD family protein [Altibacter sp.]